MDEALELRREDEINKYDRQEEHEIEARAGGFVLQRLPRVIPLDRSLKFLAGDPVEVIERLSETDSRDKTGSNRRGADTIVVVELFGRHSFIDLQDVRQLYEPARPANVNIMDRIGGLPGLCSHL